MAGNKSRTPKHINVKVPTLNIDGAIGIKYKIFYSHNKIVKPLLSFKLMSDGSLILFENTKLSDRVWGFNINTSRGGKKIIKFKDNEVKVEPSDTNIGKITFHTSGIINTFKRRFVRDSLRTMDCTQPLCSIIHRHDSFIDQKIVKDKNNTANIIINLELKDIYIQSRLFISAANHNNINTYLQNASRFLINIKFKSDTIEHSDKELLVHYLIECGPKVNEQQKSKKDITLFICLSDNVIPKYLKPNK